MGTETRPSRLLLLAAYGAIYGVWGSTYLAIRFTVRTLPPFLTGGIRFFLAGLLLYALVRPRTEAPTPRGWLQAHRIGFLAFFLSYGAVTWAEIYVPSGVVALIVALEPLCFLLTDWFCFQGPRPVRMELWGLALGFGGTVLLLAGDPNVSFHGTGGVYLLGALAVLATSFAWVYGSLLTRTAPVHPDGVLAAAMQMIAGGSQLLLLGTLWGDWKHLGEASLLSVLSLAYLVVFGSLVAYTAFTWLLKVEPVSRVATHAFVNPVVAVFLGWLFGGERVGPETLVAGGLIVGAVVLTLWARKPEL